MRVTIAALFVVIATAITDAHVIVVPQESKPGARERYTVVVPTEGQVATESVELQVPPDVQVTRVLVPVGYTYEIRREGDRIVAITWRQQIKPGEIGEFVFYAMNPKTARIVWKARQRFTDGSSADWTGVEGDRRPASITELRAAR